MRNTKQNIWQPINLEKISLDMVDKLDEILILLVKQNNNISLMGRIMGIANFFFYYGKFSNDQKYYDISNELIPKVFNLIEQNSTILTFAGGLAGFGWMIEHFKQQGFIEVDTNEVLADID